MAQAHDYDEDYGSDDAFNDLPSQTLLQLEQKALASTQHKKLGGGLSTIIKRSNSRTWLSQRAEAPYAERSLPPPQSQPAADYGLDEDIIDLDLDQYVLQQQPRGRSVDTEIPAQEKETPSGHIDHVALQQVPAGSLPNLEQLLAQITQLENDREILRQQVEEAKASVLSKTGEAAILRQKAEKAAREHELKVSSLRQQHEEEFAKQKVELQRISRERENLHTDNRFLEHDLLEANKARQIQRRNQRVGIASASTPKKSNKLQPYGDGFDDGDIPMLSPSKKRTSTPKAGTKRKRGGTEGQSPARLPALPLSDQKPSPVPPPVQNDTIVTTELLRKLSLDHRKLRFMQNLITDRIDEDNEENYFEVMAKFAFPSEPKITLGRISYDRLASSSITGDSDRLPQHFMSHLAELWERCLAEKYYLPIACIQTTVQSVLASERSAFARDQIQSIVPLAMATADLVAVPRARASLQKSPPKVSSFMAQPRSAPAKSARTDETKQDPTAEISKFVDLDACLAILQHLADAAEPSTAAISTFWACLKFDFILLMLMKAQPIHQISATISLLLTSALLSTFGTLAEEAERQSRRELELLDRLTLLLTERFPSADDLAVYNLRSKLVTLFTRLLLTDHGATLLATHRHAIARLFLSLHTALTNLDRGPHPATRPPLLSAINRTTTLLYHLCSSHGQAALAPSARIPDLHQKLVVLQGGVHLHLLALTRLAFAERLLTERGIDDATVERAHEMLDEWLSPDEGEALMLMFGSVGAGTEEGQGRGEEPAEGEPEMAG